MSQMELQTHVERCRNDSTFLSSSHECYVLLILLCCFSHRHVLYICYVSHFLCVFCLACSGCVLCHMFCVFMYYVSHVLCVLCVGPRRAVHDDR